MKTILTAIVAAAFLLALPTKLFAGEADTKKEAQKDDKKAPDKGATKKDDPPKSDAYKLRGR